MSDDNFVKAPGSRLDYTWDWSEWLDEVTDTIQIATVDVPPGLTSSGSAVVDGGFVIQRVEGGSANETYRLVCQITTVGGLIDEEPIYLTIREQ